MIRWKHLVLIMLMAVLISACDVVQQAYADTFSSFQEQEDYLELILEDTRERLRTRGETSELYLIWAQSDYLEQIIIREQEYHKRLTEQELDKLIEKVKVYEEENNLLWQAEKLRIIQDNLKALYPDRPLEVYGIVSFFPTYVNIEMFHPDRPDEIDEYGYSLATTTWEKKDPVWLNPAIADWYRRELKEMEFANVTKVYKHALAYVAEHALTSNTGKPIPLIQLLPHREEDIEFRVYLKGGRDMHTLLYDEQGTFIERKE